MNPNPYSRATNPSQFEIEFFVNDLEKPGACTFESIGGFEYKQNGSIHLECKRKVSMSILRFVLELQMNCLGLQVCFPPGSH